MKILLFAALLFGISTTSAACDVTVSQGTNLHPVVATSGLEVCLNPGVYGLTQTLNLAQDVTLRGLGASRDDVVLWSSATNAIIEANSGTTIRNLKIDNVNGYMPTYGILTYYDTNVLIWGVRVTGNLINIGVNGSSGVTIADSFMSLNGVNNNGVAEPNLWINAATDVTVDWGEAKGAGDGPSGNGEISCYDSYDVDIYGTSV